MVHYVIYYVIYIARVYTADDIYVSRNIINTELILKHISPLQQ